MMSTPCITHSVAVRLAARYSVDPRSILRIARGLPVRGLAGERAREALRAYVAELAAQGLALASIPETK